MNKNVIYCLFIIFCPLLIGLYGYYRCKNLETHNDLFGFSLFNNSQSDYGLDGWSLTHLFFYMLIGYLFPEKMVFTISLGIIWELFETYIGLYKPSIFKEFGFCSTDNSKVWWYGKYSDILVNFIGFIIGQHLALN